MTDQLKLLPLIEIDSPEAAKEQQGPAEAHLRKAIAAREQADAEYEKRLAVEHEDKRAAEYLHGRIAELTPATREKRLKIEHEIVMLREACDAASYAQDLRKDEDMLALYTSAYADLVERQRGLHQLDTMEALLALNDAKASEADAMALLSHIRTVVTLESAFREEGRIGFVGARTQELIAAAREAHRVAGVSVNDLREARANYEKLQNARINKGVITSATVSGAIPKY